MRYCTVLFILAAFCVPAACRGEEKAVVCDGESVIVSFGKLKTKSEISHLIFNRNELVFLRDGKDSGGAYISFVLNSGAEGENGSEPCVRTIRFTNSSGGELARAIGKALAQAAGMSDASGTYVAGDHVVMSVSGASDGTSIFIYNRNEVVFIEDGMSLRPREACIKFSAKVKPDQESKGKEYTEKITFTGLDNAASMMEDLVKAFKADLKEREEKLKAAEKAKGNK
ncbi:MAG: hypothetical protein JXR97_04900 [Planctomycetes bacterium]|nr:hypothetical protein [Planctomycetota bacterium]